MSATPKMDSVTHSHSYSPWLEEDVNLLCDVSSRRLTVSTPDQPLFLRRCDYWVIRYQGRVAFVKAARGLEYLALLLRDPGREYHVSELVAQAIEKSAKPAKPGQATVASQGRLMSDLGPILDAQAKAEYKCRLHDLRRDLKEAERLNDSRGAERARSEINALAEQLASATGLGGRNRKSGSEAERARSAVTKRIKNSINKIGEAIPSLHRHLVARIKTGYFCSYNPDPQRLVAWKF